MARLLGADGTLWPDHSDTCPVCRMPADPSLDGHPHPMCTPPGQPDTTTAAAAAVELVENLLGGEVTNYYTTRWLVSGQPINPPATTADDPDRSAS